MKNVVGTASVIKDTNRLVSSTSNNCNGVRSGSFLKFQSDANHYIVNNIKSLLFICEFNKISNQEIEINEDTGINIGRGDEIVISHKEYELQTILNITNPGENYQIGDSISIDGGVPLVNIQDNTTEKIQIRVNNTNEHGGITKIAIDKKGRYVETPISPFKAVGGQGSGGEFNLQFKICNQRNFIERTVQDVRFDGSKTFLTLTYTLPQEIKTGKLSVDKWEIFLTSN